jgi:Ca2+-binding RTX toxin-like protein
VPKLTPNRAFPYENDEFDILVGTLDEDEPRDEDGTTYGFYEKNDFFEENDFSEVLSFYFQGGDGVDEFFGGPNDDIIKGGKGIDTLYGFDGDDRIYGGGDGDYLWGNNDNDELFGEDGSDKLWGGANNDKLVGGEMTDWLNGGEDDDLLVGGAGADHLTGGSGLDYFAFGLNEINSFEWHDSNDFNPDTIWDFHGGDTIVLQGGWYSSASDLNYEEATIEHGAGYDVAKSHAESLLNTGGGFGVEKSYVFVTDEVDGYLFVDWFKPDGDGDVTDDIWAGVEVGIMLKGLTSESDFHWSAVTTGVLW